MLGNWVGASGGLNRWKMTFEPSGSLKLVKPDGSTGWDGWSWQINEQNELLISVPGTGQKKVELSKRADQITFDWGPGERFHDSGERQHKA